MRIPIILLTLIYFQTYHCTSTNRMVEIYGAPDNYTEVYKTYNDWNLCLGNCWKDNWCTMVYWNAQIETCWYFKYGNVNSVKKLNGSSGEKVNSTSDSCPSSNPLLSGASFSTISSYKKYITTISYVKSTAHFEFNYSTQQYCPDETKQFSRETTVVCIGLINAGKTITGYEASALCKTGKGMSLTGPYDSVELNYISSQITPSGAAFWIDGMSNKIAQKFIMEDNTHNGASAYKYFPGKPDATYKGCCLYFPLIVGYDYGVDDIGCNETRPSIIGSVCRFHPNF